MEVRIEPDRTPGVNFRAVGRRQVTFRPYWRLTRGNQIWTVAANVTWRAKFPNRSGERFPKHFHQRLKIAHFCKCYIAISPVHRRGVKSPADHHLRSLLLSFHRRRAFNSSRVPIYPRMIWNSRSSSLFPCRASLSFIFHAQCFLRCVSVDCHNDKLQISVCCLQSITCRTTSLWIMATATDMLSDVCTQVIL